MATSTRQGGIGTLSTIVIDVINLEICSTFWLQMLGADVLYQDERYVRLGHEGDLIILMLQKVAEPHQGKNRVHIDLDVTDLEAAVKRVQELGGRRLQAVTEYGIEWVIMADPDGNEFCLVNPH
jgi:predicted enzyme related to lactoylglutathione lyase